MNELYDVDKAPALSSMVLIKEVKNLTSVLPYITQSVTEVVNPYNSTYCFDNNNCIIITYRSIFNYLSYIIKIGINAV